jgi:hypothetical protein
MEAIFSSEMLVTTYKTDLSASRSARPTSRHEDLQDRPLGIKIYKTDL